MTFTRIDLLPRRDLKKAERFRRRWDRDEDGRQMHEFVMKRIREGAGEDFLQWDFEAGKLPLLNDYTDLAGLSIHGLDINFPDGDNFENIDFSHGEFYHSTFTNACFPQTHFRFTRLYNVKFKDCLFALAYFYGCRVERCTFENCDFVEGNGFTNCDFKDTTFSDCFIYENVFRSCQFDSNVVIRNGSAGTVLGLIANARRFNQNMRLTEISEIYKGIKEAYVAGDAMRLARQYQFLQRQAATRFSVQRETVKGYLWEYLAGYGLKPLRVLFAFALSFFIVQLWFWLRLGSWNDSLILSAGAFLTFGAKTDLLEQLAAFDRAVYIVSAFAGISLIALFVTVLANVLLSER